jgi:hypothetical protein
LHYTSNRTNSQSSFGGLEWHFMALVVDSGGWPV